jgi:hypothetical protein
LCMHVLYENRHPEASNARLSACDHPYPSFSQVMRIDMYTCNKRACIIVWYNDVFAL